MKLLSKNELAQQKNLERKTEIDEGAKLARRIDSLRETYSKESVTLEKFHRETKSGLESELVALGDKKNVLINEVSDLIDKKVGLYQQTITELDQVKAEKARIEELLIQVDGKKIHLEHREKDYLNRMKKLETQKEQIDYRNNEIEDRKRTLQSSQNDIDKALVDAEKSLKRIKEKEEQTEKALLSREITISAKERELAIMKKNIEEKEREMVKIKIQLADQRATLERAMQRIKK